MLLLNSFSLNMLPALTCQVRVSEVTAADVRRLIRERGFVSVVGHADTAAIFSGILGVEVLPNRATVTLDYEMMAVVGQYKGPRLPEGATALPEGAVIKWCILTVEAAGSDD